MTFDTDAGMSSLTWVNKVVQSPVSQLRIMLKEGKNRESTLYNVSARLCDIDAMIKKIPMLQQVFAKATKQGNYSFDCPMTPGLYVMENMRIGGRSPALALMYRPKARYEFIGGLFNEAKNKTLLPLSTYRISVKIVKKPCSAS